VNAEPIPIPIASPGFAYAVFARLLTIPILRNGLTAESILLIGCAIGWST
jgi:hypothetical protein